uniref:Uncharacterized protein n=1 Tax=Euplotes crassus TaxID=5936 RepID=A0A7S3K7F7_EUPCR|mmetsp:Transcript_13569/g.13501  ORF Transcript_13569/g.13501 Transcript_13569/m.13501 type:complete len:172 (+) Transcript_13569:816-1331(+)
MKNKIRDKDSAIPNKPVKKRRRRRINKNKKSKKQLLKDEIVKLKQDLSSQKKTNHHNLNDVFAMNPVSLHDFEEEKKATPSSQDINEIDLNKSSIADAFFNIKTKYQPENIALKAGTKDELINTPKDSTKVKRNRKIRRKKVNKAKSKFKKNLNEFEEIPETSNYDLKSDE